MTQTKLERKTLREWREQAGLSLGELAELVECSKSALSLVETGMTSSGAGVGRRATEALGIEKCQVVDLKPSRPDIDPENWPDDGLMDSAPRRNLAWWRMRRALSQNDLAFASGVAVTTIKAIERESYSKVKSSTRRRIAAALKVSPHKLVMPGDGADTTTEESLEATLRAELRGARRALRRTHDFLRDDSNITFRAQDNRDVLLRDVEKEVRGL